MQPFLVNGENMDVNKVFLKKICRNKKINNSCLKVLNAAVKPELKNQKQTGINMHHRGRDADPGAYF